MNKSRQAQSVLDMALQLMGSCDNIVEFASLNNLSLDADVAIDTKFITNEIIDEDIQEYWTDWKKPATGYPLIINEPLTDFFPGLPGMLPMML